MAGRKRFYVSLTWHDWPTGGSFGTVVEAETEGEAESLARQAMAQHYAAQYKIEDEPDQCSNCGNTDQDGSDICIDCGGTDCSWTSGKAAVDQVLEDYDESWNLVDCFDLDEFIAARTKTE